MADELRDYLCSIKIIDSNLEKLRSDLKNALKLEFRKLKILCYLTNGDHSL